MNSEPSFQLASEADADTLVQFMREYYAYDGHGFDETKARGALTALLRNPNFGKVWLVLDGGTPAGYIVLCFGYSLEWLGRDAFVDEFYLLDDYRGRGWGSKTMSFLEDAARQAGVTTLHLEVVHRNEGALNLYSKLGFTKHASTFMSKWISKDFSKPSGNSAL